MWVVMLQKFFYQTRSNRIQLMGLYYSVDTAMVQVKEREDVLWENRI